MFRNYSKKTKNEPVRERAEQPKKKKGSSAKYAVISALCTMLVFLIIAGVLAFTVFKDQIFKPEDSISSSEPITTWWVQRLG